jgi:hypothetical protein
MRNTTRCKRRAAALLAIAMLAGRNSITSAANWTGLVSNNWGDAGNWDTNAVPVNGEVADIIIGGLGFYDVNLNYVYTAQTALASIDVDSSSSKPTYSEVDQPKLREDITVGELVVGDSHRGYWFDTAMLTDTVNDDLVVGNASTAIGVYNMSLGSLIVAGTEYVGLGGQGTLNESGSSNTVNGNGLFLGYSSSGVGTYNLSAALTVATSEYVGYQGKGIFTQTAGSHAINGTGASGLYLGWTASGVGSFALAGGALAVASNEDIGCSGSGTFIQSGGTNSTTSLYLGVDGAGDGLSASGSGSYNLTGGSLVTIGGSPYSYQVVGYYGNGSFAQHGGSNTLGSTSLSVNLYVGYYGGSNGVYTMDAIVSAPSLTVTGSEILGAIANTVFGGAVGSFNQSAGTHSVAGKLTIGAASGSTGLFLLSGTSQLNVGGSEQIGLLGTGVFNQSGGTNTATSLQIDPNGTGLADGFILSGGVLQVNSLTNNGLFDQIGGNLFAATIVNTRSFVMSGSAPEISVSSMFTNSGTTVVAGTQNWSAGAIFANTGGETTFDSDAGSPGDLVLTVLVSGGVVSLASTEHLSSVSISNGATVVVSAATTKSVVVANALSIGGTGTLNLQANAVDIAGGTLATISTEVQQGYAGGNWNGSGITSSVAAADSLHLTAVGVIQNNQGGTALYTAANPFAGIIPAAGDILVEYTYYGDTNLDGEVDGSDYSRIDNGSLNHLTGWFNGDFNYDGVIDGSDYTLIDNAFNTQGASLAAVASGTAQIDGSSSAVPEPGAMGMAAAGVCMLLSRRKQKRFQTG